MTVLMLSGTAHSATRQLATSALVLRRRAADILPVALPQPGSQRPMSRPPERR